MSFAFSPPQTGESDGAYLFDISYRPKDSLSLAERAAYGLEAQPASFRTFLARSIRLTDSSPPARGSLVTARMSSFVLSHLDALARRLASATAGKSAAAISDRPPPQMKTIKVRRAAVARGRGILFRFTSRCAGAVWTGIVSRGCVIVCTKRAEEEPPDGDQHTSREHHGGSAYGRDPRNDGQRR
jgi:hypothetical protein